MLAALSFLLVVLTSGVERADAQLRIGLTGPFTGYRLQVPQGGHGSGYDLHVILVNSGDEAAIITIATETPEGIELVPSMNEFELPPGEQERVFFEVLVDEKVAAGTYTLKTTATGAPPVTDPGVRIATAVGAEMDLEVLGTAASVTIRTVGPDGLPAVAVLRLFQLTAERAFEVGRSEDGLLEQRVVPGSYRVDASMAGEVVGTREFTLADGEHKEIDIEVRVVFFEFASAVPHREGGKVVFIQINTTIKNLFRPLEDVNVILDVERDATPLAADTIAAFPVLGEGRSQFQYSYVPADGWVAGTYGFLLRLQDPDRVYAQQSLEPVIVRAGGRSPWIYVGAGLAAAALLAGLAITPPARRRLVGLFRRLSPI